MNRDLLRQELIRDEGLRLKPYRCTQGKLTIGIGRNLDDNGISNEEAEILFNNDLRDVESDLDRGIPWWRVLSDARQRVLANMCFNMGLGTLLTFKNTLAAMEAGDYQKAAAGMRASLWARQVGPRADRLIKMMVEG